MKEDVNLIVSTSIKYQHCIISVFPCFPCFVVPDDSRASHCLRHLYTIFCLEKTMGCGMLGTDSLIWEAHSQTEASLYLEVDFKPRPTGQINPKRDIVGSGGSEDKFQSQCFVLKYACEGS